MLMLRLKRPDVNPSCRIDLPHGLYALVDPEDKVKLDKYFWRVKNWKKHPYAYRRKQERNRIVEIYMHRQIMHTPSHLITHHKNLITLDNRKENLENMVLTVHKEIHRFL